MARTFGGASTDKITTTLTSHATQRSYSIWSYRTGDGGGGFGRMFDKGGDSPATEGLWNDSSGGGELGYSYQRFFSGGSGQWTTDALPSGSVWHHVVVTFDASSASNTPVFYIDGSVASATRFATPSGAASTNANAYVVGNRSSDNARNWSGGLTEFAVWNAILSAADVNALLRGSSPLNISVGNLAGYWPLRFNQSPEPDYSGNTSAATVSGTVKSADPAPFSPVWISNVHYRPGQKPGLPFIAQSDPDFRVTSSLFSQVIQGTLNITPSFIRSIGKTVSVTSNVTPTVAKSVGKIFSVVSNITPSVVKSVGKSVVSNLTITGSVAALKVKVQNIVANLTITPSFTKSVGKIVSITVNVTPAITNFISKSLSVTCNITASVVKAVGTTISVNIPISRQVRHVVSYHKLISSSVTVATSVGNTVGKIVSATCVTTPSYIRQVAKIVSSNVTVSPVVSKVVGKLVSVGVTVNGVVSAVLQAGTQYVQSIVANLTITPSFKRTVGKIVSVSAVCTPSYVKQISTHMVPVTVNVSASVVKKIAKTVKSNVTITATVGTYKGVVTAKAITVTLTVTGTIKRCVFRSMTVMTAAAVGLTAMVKSTLGLTAATPSSASMTAVTKSSVSMTAETPGSQTMNEEGC